MLKLLKEFNLELFAQNDKGESILELLDKKVVYNSSITRIDAFGKDELRELSIIVKVCFKK